MKEYESRTKPIIEELKKYSEKDIHPTIWYESKTIIGRDMDHKFILKTYFEFDKIYYIEEEILKYGDIGYDLYYKLSNSKTLVIGICKKKKIEFLHAYLILQGLERIIKWKIKKV